MEEIIIERTGEDDEGLVFRVMIIDNTDRTVHDVYLSFDDYERFGFLSRSPERFVEHCFQFLLEREPKDSIQSRFEIGALAEYFPDFLEKLRPKMMADLRSKIRAR
jgi:hypothetical protein